MEGSFLKRRDINLVQLVVGILFFVVAILSAGPPCLAQEAIKQGPQPAPAAAPPPVFQPPQPTAPPAAMQAPTKKGEVRFNFDDADLFDVIQTVFGDILRVNYMVDPKVKGRVNFRTVTPVSKEDVLPLMGVLLKMNGAGYVDDKGLYRILPINEIPGTAPKVFVYPLQNTKAKHVATLLQSIFSSVSTQATPGKFIPQSPAGPGGFCTCTGSGSRWHRFYRGGRWVSGSADQSIRR